MGFFSKLVKGILGVDDSAEKAAKAEAKRAERALEAQRQAQLLNAQNELDGSTEITMDANTFGDTSADNRRRKRSTGAATSNLGLNV